MKSGPRPLLDMMVLSWLLRTTGAQVPVARRHLVLLLYRHGLLRSNKVHEWDKGRKCLPSSSTFYNALLNEKSGFVRLLRIVGCTALESVAIACLSNVSSQKQYTYSVYMHVPHCMRYLYPPRPIGYWANKVTWHRANIGSQQQRSSAK